MSALRDIIRFALLGKPPAARRPAYPKNKPYGGEVPLIEPWCCGNGHLQAQFALLLVKANGVTEAAAMRWLDDTAYQAGAGFCAEMVDQMMCQEVPF